MRRVFGCCRQTRAAKEMLSLSRANAHIHAGYRAARIHTSVPGRPNMQRKSRRQREFSFGSNTKHRLRLDTETGIGGKRSALAWNVRALPLEGISSIRNVCRHSACRPALQKERWCPSSREPRKHTCHHSTTLILLPTLGEPSCLHGRDEETASAKSTPTKLRMYLYYIPGLGARVSPDAGQDYLRVLPGPATLVQLFRSHTAAAALPPPSQHGPDNIHCQPQGVFRGVDNDRSGSSGRCRSWRRTG